MQKNGEPDETETIYVTVRLKIKPGLDIDTLVEELDYHFFDDEDCIIETEIMEWTH